jgi:hypothetical protein
MWKDFATESNPVAPKLTLTDMASSKGALILKQ